MPPAKILIVEDESVLANAVRINLENMGYSVPGIFAAGEPALEYIRTTPPDLVIMDVTLQGEMDGVQTAEAIRSIGNIPVIFITAHSDPGTIKRAISATPFGYLVKPFQTRELRLTIELALQNRAMEQAILDQAARANTLVRVASQINQTLDLDQVLEAVSAEVMAIFKVPGAAVILVDEPGGKATAAASKGLFEKNNAASPMPAPAAVLEQTWKAQGAVVEIPDPAVFLQDLALSHPLATDVKAVVIAFLVNNDRMIGSIVIPCESALHKFNAADLSLFGAIADLAAIAISHARLFEQVAEGRRRLQILSRQMVEVQESERRHLANELHDQIGQMLTGLQFSLEMGKVLPDEELKGNLAASQEIVKEIIAQVRELSLDLRPSLLDDMGLHECLNWHFDRFTRQTGVEIHFSDDRLGANRFQPDVEITVFRIVQEALTNITRHANVREAWINIDVCENEILIQIDDQGQGFDLQSVEAEYSSVGLGGMRERANLVGGELEIVTAPGGGTQIKAHIPTQNRIERRKYARNRNPGR